MIRPPAPSKPTPEGWGKPMGSALRHYIRNQQALCGLWGFFGDVRTDKSTNEKCERCAAEYLAE